MRQVVATNSQATGASKLWILTRQGKKCPPKKLAQNDSLVMPNVGHTYQGNQQKNGQA